MNKAISFLILLFACIPFMICAQEVDNSKYLAGAVPEVDGRVVFSKEFDLPGMTQEQIFDNLHRWLEERFKKNKDTGRITYSEKEKGQIAGIGEEYLIFASTALSLDRSLMNYRITINVQPGKGLVEIENIRFTYREKEKYTAEEWITDKYALNKTKTKLVRGLSKFRIKTVDYMNNLLAEAQAALPVTASSTAKPDVSSIPAIVTSNAESPVVSTSSLPGYKQIAPDKIPGNIIKMLTEDWMLITAGNKEKFNMMTASWGGLGSLYGKPVALCFINPTRYTYQLMETHDTYTFSFYTEAYREVLRHCGSKSGKDSDKVKDTGLTPVTTPEGSKAFSEAWLIIECRKLVSQSLTPEAISNKEIKDKWADKQLHKMYVGEIINVWVK